MTYDTRWIWFIAWLVVTAMCGGCVVSSDSNRGLASRSGVAGVQQVSFETESPRKIHVVSHGWHTGIVLPTADVSPGIWPEVEAFRDYAFVEIGWGDEGFYRMDGLQAGTLFKAAFLPTPSVLHIAAFESPPTEVFQVSDIIEVPLAQSQFANLCRFVAESSERGSDGRAVDLGEGRYGYSRFYRGRGSYFLPTTCNVWTARALQAAGQPVTPSLCVTADAVVRQTNRFGYQLQEADPGLKRAMLRASSDSN
ncbi:MAG: DUF2459 domain-containing protein [Planctomycetaceae bacterium]